ncbi:hypothetical protein SK128_021828 [Halocaridina rubra]|uniref:Uncharacterized protein n=1 Tax=Halocaridina rubra TaxID=373956 RepID=A0AAN8X1D8_HALRR
MNLDALDFFAGCLGVKLELKINHILYKFKCRSAPHLIPLFLNIFSQYLGLLFQLHF